MRIVSGQRSRTRFRKSTPDLARHALVAEDDLRPVSPSSTASASAASSASITSNSSRKHAPQRFERTRLVVDDEHGRVWPRAHRAG